MLKFFCQSLPTIHSMHIENVIMKLLLKKYSTVLPV